MVRKRAILKLNHLPFKRVICKQGVEAVWPSEGDAAQGYPH